MSIFFFILTRLHEWVRRESYCPDLVPCDIWLFPRLKTALEGSYFTTVDEIKTNVMGQLKHLTEDEFAKCFQGWQNMQKCVDSGGGTTKGTMCNSYLNILRVLRDISKVYNLRKTC